MTLLRGLGLRQLVAVPDETAGVVSSVVGTDSVAVSRYMFPTGSVVMDMHEIISAQTSWGRTTETRDRHLDPPAYSRTMCSREDICWQQGHLRSQRPCRRGVSVGRW
jgi:hypothetical protein